MDENTQGKSPVGRDPDEGDEENESGMAAKFDRFASRVTELAGSPIAFCLALLVVLVWAISGPVFGFSETWQLVINTGTTIITFLMVFLIQQSQNKDSRAVHVKLDELLKLQINGGDEMIDIENLSEHQVRHLAEQFRRKKL